jgi:hypothetical protein
MGLNNVIDIRSRLKDRKENSIESSESHNSEVVNLEEAKAIKISSERRQNKRIVLSEFISAFIVVPQKGLLRVALYDLSETGLAFDIPSEAGNFSVGEQVSIRFYLNKKTYFAVPVKFTHARWIENEGVVRHGVEFSKSAAQDLPLQHFVKFIETVGNSLKLDNGDLQVSSRT